MNDKEKKALLKARMRNLERKYARIKEHADLVETAIELKAEIDSIKLELDSLN